VDIKLHFVFAVAFLFPLKGVLKCSDVD